MNAIELLASDHRKVEDLFDQLDSNDADKIEVFKKIKALLEAHAHIEEKIFYPAMQSIDDPEVRELVGKALADHDEAKSFLGEISASAADSDAFDGLLNQLADDTRTHISEEENEMFVIADHHFNAEELEKLGSQMDTEKREFAASTDTIHNS